MSFVFWGARCAGEVDTHRRAAQILRKRAATISHTRAAEDEKASAATAPMGGARGAPTKRGRASRAVQQRENNLTISDCGVGGGGGGGGRRGGGGGLLPLLQPLQLAIVARHVQRPPM